MWWTPRQLQPLRRSSRLHGSGWGGATPPSPTLGSSPQTPLKSKRSQLEVLNPVLATLGRSQNPPQNSLEGGSRRFENSQKMSKKASMSQLASKEAGAMRTRLILHPFWGPPGGPKLMSNRPRDVPRDAQGGFEVKKTRL